MLLADPSIGEIGAVQVGTVQTDASHARPALEASLGVAQVGPSQVGVVEVVAAELGILQVGASEGRFYQLFEKGKLGMRDYPLDGLVTPLWSTGSRALVCVRSWRQGNVCRVGG